MLHVDLFAGIGGFSLGFDSAGAQTSAIVEWDENCQELLGRRFPGVPIHGDIKTVGGAELGHVDILTGGFPCQDISIAGRRAGLAGDRSGHFWEFARLIDETHPEWVVIENVRGLLSSGGRRDMGAVLGTLGDLGYGWAYRVLDAQFFGVPQRRQRVFIVGRAGADRDSAGAVLLEPEGVRRDSAAGREAGTVVAALTRDGLGGGGPDDNLAQAGHLQPVAIANTAGDTTLGLGGENGGRVAPPLTLRHGDPGIVFQPEVAATLSAGGHSPGVNPPGRRKEDDQNVVAYGVALRGREGGGTAELGGDAANDLRAAGGGGSSPYVLQGYAVRKLMPLECERLQGFPDAWTDGFPDTTRYRMLGNAVAVPVVEWLAERLVAVAGQQRGPRRGLTASEFDAFNRLKGIA